MRTALGSADRAGDKARQPLCFAKDQLGSAQLPTNAVCPVYAGIAISLEMTSGHVQDTGSSVYKPPLTGPGWRLPRSQLGPGSEPCNNPTRVVAQGVARLAQKASFEASWRPRSQRIRLRCNF